MFVVIALQNVKNLRGVCISLRGSVWALMQLSDSRHTSALSSICLFTHFSNVCETSDGWRGVWEWAEGFKAWQFSRICRSTPTFREFFKKWTLFVWSDWRWVVQENFVFKIVCIFCHWYTEQRKWVSLQRDKSNSDGGGGRRGVRLVFI